MLGHRELTMEDYAEILKRRFWVILICAIVFLAAGAGVSHIIPPRYLSQTLVLVEQQQVPQDYVKPVITEGLEQRLASMKEQILSRSRIQPIIERYNLFAGYTHDMDQRVALTQKAIGIRPIPAARGGMSGFYITFEARNPRIAQLVCGEITSLFVTSNLDQLEQSAEGTTDFLRQELDDSKRNLDDQDAKLAVFEQQHFGMLPDQETSNSNTLQALTTQLDAATETLSRLQQNQTFLQAMIAQQTREQQGNEPIVAAAADSRRRQLQALIEQKQTLEALYTPDYPDVVAVTRKIADLRAEIAQEPAQPAPAPAPSAFKEPDSPQLQQLKAQLRVAQQSMAEQKQEQARLEQQIQAYEARIESTPKVEEEYKQLTRDHDTALQFYNSLLAKMNESSMATALQQRQQGEQFRVMDAPNFPEAPYFPNHLVFAAGGGIGGLAVGLLIVALLEYRDTSLRSERDVWAFTKLPTLATLSHIEDLRRLRRAAAASSFHDRLNPWKVQAANMYRPFFGLRDFPFGSSPDPRFLYMMPQIREALACLQYGIAARKGFVVMTGEVGTGKTTLLRTVLGTFAKNRVSSAFVSNPRLDVLDFLEFVLTDFGIPPKTRTKSGMLLQLNRWLIERYRDRGLCLIVVDEAQNLSWELLEEIRLLTNLETSSEKLLQIVLSGQPELEKTLRDPRVRQLRQRVSIWCKTQPLTADQTQAYIAERLRIAGSQQSAFTSEAAQLVHHYAKGIPRIINLICEHAMISAYVEQIKPIPARIVESVSVELDLDKHPFVLSIAALSELPGDGVRIVEMPSVELDLNQQPFAVSRKSRPGLTKNPPRMVEDLGMELDPDPRSDAQSVLPTAISRTISTHADSTDSMNGGEA